MSNFSLSILDDQRQAIANRIVSAYAFYYQAGDALLTHKPVSTVRMGDGERVLLNAAINALERGDGEQPVADYDLAWRQRMGVEGITYAELFARLQEAGNSCSHFCPSVSGLTQQAYDLFLYFQYRDHYVDNFFVNIWDTPMKCELYKAAQTILFIHHSRGAADAIQIRAKKYLGVRVRYIELSNWQQSESVIDDAVADQESRLVLFAGGPASKYISPRIAASNKVVLDIGNTTDKWLLSDLQ